MNHIANVFQIMNTKFNFISKYQKGFKSSVNGAAEHITCVNELMAHATRNNKNIEILTIDFKDAFGSISHKQIYKSLLKIGFPESFCKMIKSLYKDSITNISGRSGRSEDVYLRRGVKQGCPLSPLLFNICLDPLLKLINEENEEAGYKVEDNTFIVQAFADDVILVSGSRDGMSDIIKTCERFCNLTGMKIAPQKCQWISYMLKDGKRVSSSTPLRINNEDINSIDIDDCIIYLGAPIAFNKQIKMKKTREKISDIKMEIQKIVHSPLALTQIIDALKRLIAPKLDFALLNGVTPLKCIEKLDSFIRGQIQSLLDTNGLPIDYFYTHWRDGGLSLHSLMIYKVAKSA